MRESISAIGSVIAIGNRYPPFLPTRFSDTGDSPVIGLDAETDPAHFEFTEVPVRSAADFATIVFTSREFGRLTPLFD